DHTTVGKWLAEKWNLPKIFIESIWLHHHQLPVLLDLEFMHHRDAVLVIRFADILAHRIMADTLTFHPGTEDFDDLQKHLHLKPEFTQHAAATLGKLFSEWAATLNIQEDEFSFYFHALQRANQKLATLVIENLQHQRLKKSNHELRLLHDLHLALAQLDRGEQIINFVAHMVSAELNKPDGVVYYHNQIERCLIGAYWTAGMEPEPFQIFLNEDEQPRNLAVFEAADSVRQFIASRHERIHTVAVTANDITFLQYSTPYLVIPLLHEGNCLGELALAHDCAVNNESITQEMLNTLGYLVSITQNALARVQLLEEVKGSAESLSTALAKNQQMMLLLRKSNEEFERLFEYSNDAIILHRTDGTVLRVNERTVELLGYSKEVINSDHILGKLFDDLRNAQSNRSEKDDNGKGVVFETQLQHQDGTVIDVEVSSRIFDFKSGLAQSLIRDITRQKETARDLSMEKERLAVTLRSIGDGVITTDTEGKIALINAVAEHLTGWGQEEAVGKPLQEVFRTINERTREPIGNPVDRVLASGRTVELPRFTVLVGKQGVERLIADSAAPIIDRDNTIIGVVLVFRDVTEKQKLELEILKAQKFESLGILAGGIAHDFNNILTAISGSITLAKMYAKPGEKTLEKLLQAEKASQRAKDLTRQLSSFSRGGMPEKKTASLAELIRDSVGFVLRGSNVRCEPLIADDLWPADVDAGQISQVLNNLIINADQAMTGGGIITITAENVMVLEEDTIPLASGPYVKIAVKDQGIGIPKDDLPKIFDPYFTTKREGNGLGLASAYSIMKKHNGHIMVESEPDLGTAFFLYLPAVKETTFVQEAEDDQPVSGKGRILLMDDEAEIRHLTGEMLESLGYQVDFARDGIEAVQLYENAVTSSNPFDVVIIDLTIPGSMGGKQTIQELHKIDPDVKAIIASGYTADPVLAEFKKYGFMNFITKPYKIGALSRILYTLVNNGSADELGVETSLRIPETAG
ncbi:MAG TPA: PAS domain S-box protein, partial [Thermodesulfobacteriota bacterium]|nr:PAS domain S-box protein [Thermodesulfobacteriota bacterium]